MRLLHARDRRLARLLAAGALDGGERERALRHLDGCAACRAEHDELRAFLELLAHGRTADPPLPLAAFAARVHAVLDDQERGTRARLADLFRPPRAAALRATGVAAAAVLALVTVVRAPQPAPPFAATAAEPGARATWLLPAESMRRIERRVAREQTARYLVQAEDVLVTVAASLPRCTRHTHHVDVGVEARRSRELLARRALVLEADAGHAAAAEAVLHDVERALREVAAFDDCERSGRVEALGAELDRRRLLMRIALVERELQG